MSERWWRAYEGAVDNPKLQLLPAPLFKSWFNLLCLASANSGKLPPIAMIVFKLRMSESRVRHTIAELVTRKLIDDRDGTLVPHNWEGRQYKSDVTDPTAAERMRNYRNRHRNDDRNAAITVTPPRVQSTETEKKECAYAHSPPTQKRQSKKPKTRLPDGWRPESLDPSDEAEFARFRNSALAHGRLYADWEAAWRNWKTSPYQTQRRTNGTVQNGSGPRRGSRDDLRERTVQALDKLREFAERGPDADGCSDGGQIGSPIVGRLPTPERPRS